jgi:aminomethyltransferase
MGEFFIAGSSAQDALSSVVTHDLSTLKTGKCRYGFMLNENGGVLDDLIIYRLDVDRFMAVVNGACIASDFAWMRKHLPSSVRMDDRSMDMAKIDLQGPASFEVLSRRLPVSDWKELGYFSFCNVEWSGFQILVSRTGYTGELGYEIYLSWDAALEIWEELIRDEAVLPAGLGARDTLRLEVGLPLYGQDLDTEHTPVEAGYGFMIKSQAPFIGRDKLDKMRERLVPLIIDGRRSPRHGDEIANMDGHAVGRVTSGSFAPSLGHCVALAYVQTDHADDAEFLIRCQRFEVRAKKGSTPFYDKGTARIKLT